MSIKKPLFFSGLSVIMLFAFVAYLFYISPKEELFNKMLDIYLQNKTVATIDKQKIKTNELLANKIIKLSKIIQETKRYSGEEKTKKTEDLIKSELDDKLLVEEMIKKEVCYKELFIKETDPNANQNEVNKNFPIITKQVVISQNSIKEFAEKAISGFKSAETDLINNQQYAELKEFLKILERENKLELVYEQAKRELIFSQYLKDFNNYFKEQKFSDGELQEIFKNHIIDIKGKYIVKNFLIGEL